MSEAAYDCLQAVVLVGGLTVVSYVVARWVNRHADKEDNGGHHEYGRVTDD